MLIKIYFKAFTQTTNFHPHHSTQNTNNKKDKKDKQTKPPEELYHISTPLLLFTLVYY